jgi:hypothetical protein
MYLRPGIVIHSFVLSRGVLFFISVLRHCTYTVEDNTINYKNRVFR